MIDAAGLSDPGCARPNNEDSFLVREDLGLFVVADGMGGAAAGEVASKIFVRAVEEVFLSGLKRRLDRRSLVMDAFMQAHRQIKEDARRFPEHHGMGCTAELLTFGGDVYYLGHVGDSRTYIKDRSGFRQLTTDHTYVQEQIDSGSMTLDEARRHKLRHVLSRAVGYDEVIRVDQQSGPLEPESLFLLCSDGLTDELSQDAILQILNQEKDLDELALMLVDAAKDKGGRDNITVVLSRPGRRVNPASNRLRGLLSRVLQI